MGNSTKKEIWLVTFLDLVMIMTCFFVLIYSITINKKFDTEEKKHDKILPFILNEQINSGSIQVIHHMLTNHLGDNVSGVKIIPREDKLVINFLDLTNDKNNIINLGEKIGSALFHFTRNLIKISLMVDIKKLRSENENNPLSFDKKLEYLLNKVDLLTERISVYSRNDKIVTSIELLEDSPFMLEQGWNIVANIYPESKYKHNEIY